MSAAAIDMTVVPLPVRRGRRPEADTLAEVIPFPRTVQQPVAAPRPVAVSSVVLKVVLFVVALAFTVGIGARVGLALQPDVTGTAAVVVQPGQTLWEVAAAAAEPGQDVRDVAAVIAQLNGLENGTVTAGQELTVPRY